MKSVEHPEETLLFQCLELAREEREAFLESVCKGQPDLRARVLTLLRANETDRGFLDTLRGSQEELSSSETVAKGRSRSQSSPREHGKKTAKSMSVRRYRLRKIVRKLKPWGLAGIAVGALLYLGYPYIEEARQSMGANSTRTDESAASTLALFSFQTLGDDERGTELSALIRGRIEQRLRSLPSARLIEGVDFEIFEDADFDAFERIRNRGAGTLILGDTRIERDMAWVRAQIVSGIDRSAIWSASPKFVVGPDNLDLIAKAVGFSVARALAQERFPDVEILSEIEPLSFSSDALASYREGMRLMETESLTLMPQAVERFESATTIDPNFAKAYVGLGFAHMKREQLTPEPIPQEERIARMQTAVDKALDLDAGLPEAHVLSGLVRKLSGDRPGAQRAFQRALQLDENCADAHMELARWQFEKRVLPWDESYDAHMKAILDSIQTAMDLEPETARYAYEMGYMQGYNGSIEGSYEGFRESVKRNPSYWKGYMAIASNDIQFKGRFDEAVAHLRKALSVDSQNVSLFEDLSLCYESMGDSDTAAWWLEQALDLRPDLEIFYQGHVYRLRGDEPSAIEHYREAYSENLALHPGFESINRHLLNYELRNGEFQAARSRYYSLNEQVSTGFGLFVDDPVVRSPFEAAFAMGIAPIRMALGETEAAHKLIEGSWAFFQSIPETSHQRAFYEALRHALKSEKAEAIAVMRGAVDSGFRTKIDIDDARLDSLREDPGFRDLQRIVDTDMAEQLARVQRMEANGELATLPETLAK